MSQIYETKNFIIEAHAKPFVDRLDGGHIRIRVKDESITDRTRLSPAVAKELMRLSMIVGEAMEVGMNNCGVKVVKINYQDMGNWAYKHGKLPFLHYHIFGRTFEAKHQIFPESVYLPARESGFYDTFESLNEDDIAAIRKQIELIATQPKYLSSEWGI